ncbi:glutamate 5-kinase, partial [Desulfovibrio sp. 1188_IL3213]
MSRQRPLGTAAEAEQPEQCDKCHSEEERSETWQQERARVLAQARVIVVKVGSAVLTDATGLSSPVLA